jgi:hypothetical protein
MNETAEKLHRCLMKSYAEMRKHRKEKDDGFHRCGYCGSYYEEHELIRRTVGSDWRYSCRPCYYRILNKNLERSGIHR